MLETIRQTLSYVRMFRKDFKLEMLAQNEESRKAELTEKQKALSGAKKRMEDSMVQFLLCFDSYVHRQTFTACVLVNPTAEAPAF